MRITNRGRYALRASLALAKLRKDVDLVSISSISEEENISSVFLEQIFFKLRKAGIVNSVRGPGGGFRFNKSPDKITLMEIMKAAGEEMDLTDCDKNAKACTLTGKRCSSHTVWEDANGLLRDYFSKMTLTMVRARKTP